MYNKRYTIHSTRNRLTKSTTVLKLTILHRQTLQQAVGTSFCF